PVDGYYRLLTDRSECERVRTLIRPRGRLVSRARRVAMNSGALARRTARSRAAPVTADEVKAAAIELFALRGYRATTLPHIASALGIQAPGLYNHVGSKQEILRNIMVGVMTELLAEQRAALESTSEVEEQVRRIIESHVRYHCRHQRATFIGNREIPSLDEP